MGRLGKDTDIPPKPQVLEDPPVARRPFDSIGLIGCGVGTRRCSVEPAAKKRVRNRSLGMLGISRSRDRGLVGAVTCARPGLAVGTAGRVMPARSHCQRVDVGRPRHAERCSPDPGFCSVVPLPGAERPRRRPNRACSFRRAWVLTPPVRGLEHCGCARCSSLIVSYPTLPRRRLPGATDEPLFGHRSAPTGQLPQAARIVARSVTFAHAGEPACWGIAAGSRC